MSYFPLDRDLLTSSTWAQASPDALKIWIYLLLAANPRNGVVEDAAPGIALRCGLSLEATIAALEWLASPDPHSRTKDFDGRRIVPLQQGGFRLLNYVKRRDKDHSTPRVRRYRERLAAFSETVRNGVSPFQTMGNGDETVLETVGNDEHEHEHEKKQTQETGRRPAAALSDKQRLVAQGYADAKHLAEKRKKTLAEVVEAASSFKTRDGRQIPGRARLEGLSEERLLRTIADLRADLEELERGGIA